MFGIGKSDVAYSILSIIEQSNAATNPYFVNTSYASFLTSQSSQATIACLMLAYSFSPKVRKYLLGSPIFPTGTKVSRGGFMRCPFRTSYASFLTSQSPQATIACLMLAYSFSPKVQSIFWGPRFSARNDRKCVARKGRKGGARHKLHF